MGPNLRQNRLQGIFRESFQFVSVKIGRGLLVSLSPPISVADRIIRAGQLLCGIFATVSIMPLAERQVENVAG
jgi:hypothetical protein